MPISGREEFEINVVNSTWEHLTKFCATYGIKVGWDGTHDPKTYTPEQLNAMAECMESFTAALRDLAKEGGATLG